MQRNLGMFDRVFRVAIGVFAIFAAVILFENWVARIFFGLVGCLEIFEGAYGWCPLHERLGLTKVGDSLKTEVLYLLGLCGVQLVLAYEWWNGGYEKFMAPDFAGGMTKTLAVFAAKNPFAWYKAYLEGYATQNALMLGYLVEFGELAVALGLAAGVVGLLLAKNDRLRRQALWLSSLALVGALIMNANFYFAAGWMSASTKGTNLVMSWIEAALCYVWMSQLAAKMQKTAAPPAV